MATIIKILIAALLVHATFRAGTAYWRYYEFQDDVHQAALFAERQTEAQLRERVMALAKTHQIPVSGDDVTVRRAQNHTIVDARYTERVELLPRYFYPWEFTVNVDVLTSVQ